MLRYFANGLVRWKNGMRCNTRTNWEFYAVIEGRCGVRFHDRQHAELREKTLWVFAPECSHGWVDDHRNEYRRIVLHYSSVPFPLDGLVRRNGGWLEKSLTDAEIVSLQAMAAELEPHYLRRDQISPLHFGASLTALSLLALAGRELAALPALPDIANFKVESALSWYAEHLPSRPKVKDLADAVHVSPSHLRRLFWQVRHTSPKAACHRIRLDKAHELMSRSALTLEDVARHCGFANSSHLCHAYRAFHDFTPTYWRKKLVDRFNKPFPPDRVFTRRYSVRPQERMMPA
jgi:AraC family transcriptional regulator